MNVDPIEFALSHLTDAELVALAETTYTKASPVPPGLMAWIEHAVDVEQHRRAGTDLPVIPPSADIDEPEEVDAQAGTIALRDTAPNERVHALFDALVNVLTAGPRH